MDCFFCVFFCHWITLFKAKSEFPWPSDTNYKQLCCHIISCAILNPSIHTSVSQLHICWNGKGFIFLLYWWFGIIKARGSWEINPQYCTHISVQKTPSAVEVESLPCWFQYHPVVIIIQQRQWDGSAWVLGTAIYLHVFHQNCTYKWRAVINKSMTKT